MAKPRLIFEANKNGQGKYECQAVAQEYVEESLSENSCQQNEQTAGDARQAYYIDPNIVHSMQPQWAAQANELFQQSLRSNSMGEYSDYLTQMRKQFELMRKTLQQQMDQYRQQN